MRLRVFVIEGVFSDEHGDYPAGTYIRNPIGTTHKPHSEDGCVIFVKLHQFDKNDTKQFSINTQKTEFLPGSAPGLTVLLLHSFEGESCALVRWAPKTKFNPLNPPAKKFMCWKALFLMNMEIIQRAHGSAPRIYHNTILTLKRVVLSM